MSRRDDDDDKYNKAKRGGRPVAYSAAKAPSSARGGSSMGGARGGTSFSSSQSVSSSPAQFGGFGGDDDADALAAKVRAKLDFVSTRAGADDEETEAERVKASLDRLAFASQVKGVRSAFGSAINDAASEIDGLASKAEETVASFQAMQYAAKWMPVDTRLSMKPTYVKVPVQAVERIKFWESEKLAMIVSQHAEEKEKILAENAGLRSMMGLEEANSPAVETMRETEDGVNRALLLSAVEEIKQLRTRITVLEGEAARSRISSSGFGSFFGGGNEGGVDSAQMSKLTTELARLEEDNGRQKWMIGEKDKQIKEVQGKYAASAAYKLQEKLQESMEALEVMANLQAEQLQYMEDHALRKLDAQDTQIADVQDDLDVKRAHLAQLKTLMKGYWETGDDSLVPPMLSLAGFSKKEAIAIDASRESLATAGLGGLVRGLGRRGYGFYEKFLVACAPPANQPRRGDRLPGPGDTPGGESPSPAPSTAPPTAERMADDIAGEIGESPAAATNPAKNLFATSEDVPESAAPTPEKAVDDVKGLANDDSLTLPSPPANPEEGITAVGESTESTVDSTVSTMSDSERKPPASLARRRENETPAEKVRREAEKSARRERQRRSIDLPPPGSATRRSNKGATEGHFAGFEDDSQKEKERKEKAKARAPLPAPKLKGKAAEREARRVKEEEARRATGDGFAGFGSDETNDSDSD